MIRPFLHLALTRARFFAARWRMRNHDTSAISKYRAKSEDAIFYIIGAGASLNDLSESDFKNIEAQTSAAINMAAVAPINCDLYAMERINSLKDCEILLSCLLGKQKQGLIWYQDRSKHELPQTKILESSYPFYRYARASVSIKGDIKNFQYAWSHFIRRKVIQTPNLSVSFALTGTLARLVLLALSLGYRRIGFTGVDLGSTRYFWLEEKPIRGEAPVRSDTEIYNRPSTGALRQGGQGVVPNFFEFLAEIKKGNSNLEFFTIDPRNRSRLTDFLMKN